MNKYLLCIFISYFSSFNSYSQCGTMTFQNVGGNCTLELLNWAPLKPVNLFEDIGMGLVNLGAAMTNSMGAASFPLTCPSSPVTYGANGSGCFFGILLATKISDMQLTKTAQGNKLVWKSSNEPAGATYTLMKSYDGINFTATNAVVVSTTANATIVRQLVDADNTGTIFYKLQLKEANNALYYSGVIKTNFVQSIVTIYPNPASNYLFINVPNNYINTNYQIHNYAGNLVKAGVIKADNSQIDISSLASGVYYFKINNSSFLKIVSFIKH
jgi:hypothetical protein